MRIASYAYFDTAAHYLSRIGLELGISEVRQSGLHRCVARGVCAMKSLGHSSSWILETCPARFELRDLKDRALDQGAHFEPDGFKYPGESGRFEDLVRDLSAPVCGVDCPSDLDILVWHGLALDPEDPEEEWTLLEILWQAAAQVEEELILTDPEE